MRYNTFILFVFLSHVAFAQELRGFLYGAVTLKNNRSYTGQLRWDNEAASWDDLFEAYKNETQLQEQIKINGYDKNREKSNEVFELSFMKLWENRDHKSRFAFRCQFGHIKKITDLKDNKYATVMLKNGEKISVRRRGDDIGQDIYLYHSSLGVLEFDWQNIKTIEFKPAPRNLKNQLGGKLYGNALTVDGPVEGYVVWDFDEEGHEKDILDGDHQKVEYKVEFGKVSTLIPEREGARLTLKDGSEIYLRNSSDVNKDNDGIFMKTKNTGMVNLKWANLIKMDFAKPAFKPMSYDDYEAPKPLTGKVITLDGKTFQGKIAYDLDEIWNIEILDGQAKGSRYFLPFHLIKSIEPQNYNYSLVTLTNDQSLMLGEEGDVNHRNNGLLVWLSESKTRYVPWKNIKSLTFTHK